MPTEENLNLAKSLEEATPVADSQPKQQIDLSSTTTTNDGVVQASHVSTANVVTQTAATQQPATAPVQAQQNVTTASIAKGNDALLQAKLKAAQSNSIIQSVKERCSKSCFIKGVLAGFLATVTILIVSVMLIGKKVVSLLPEDFVNSVAGSQLSAQVMNIDLQLPGDNKLIENDNVGKYVTTDKFVKFISSSIFGNNIVNEKTEEVAEEEAAEEEAAEEEATEEEATEEEAAEEEAAEEEATEEEATEEEATKEEATEEEAAGEEAAEEEAAEEEAAEEEAAEEEATKEEATEEEAAGEEAAEEEAAEEEAAEEEAAEEEAAEEEAAEEETVEEEVAEEEAAEEEAAEEEIAEEEIAEEEATDLGPKYNVVHTDKVEEANWVISENCNELYCGDYTKASPDELVLCNEFRLKEGMADDTHRIGNTGICRYKDSSELVHLSRE